MAYHFGRDCIMAETSNERVTCPDCGKGYRWQNTLVGRVVPCKHCDSKFTVPDAPGVGVAYAPEPAINHDGTYDLDLGDDDGPAPHASPAIGGKCPVCNTPIKENAVICMNCGFNLKEGKKMETAVEAGPAAPAPAAALSPTLAGTADRASKRADYDNQVQAEAYRQHRWDEIHFPLIVMGVGFVFFLINALVLVPRVNQVGTFGGMFSTGEAIAAHAIGFVLVLIMMIPLLLGGIFFMASVFGSAFGNLFTALLKLFTMVVLVVAFDNSIDLGLDLMTGGFGGIGYGIRFSIVLALFYPLCVKLFDMESHEIWVMFFLYVIGPIAIGLLAAIIVGAYF